MVTDAEKEVRRRLMLGRAYIETRADYYGHILYEMTFEVIPTHPKLTMGITKGLVLYVNAQWMLTDPDMQNDAVVGAVLVHECEHPLRGLDRVEALPNKELANIAGDLAINYNLLEEGWQLTRGALNPKNMNLPGGLTLEQYYELLLQSGKTPQELIQQLGGCGPNGSGGVGQGVASGACGSGGGFAVDEELEKKLDGLYGKSEAEVESAKRAMLDAVAEALAGGNGSEMGNIPGRFKELVTFRRKPPDIRWQSILRRYLDRGIGHVSGDSDYSMGHPSISAQCAGYIGPGLADRPLRVAFVEDTSGSMDIGQLNSARGEVYHCMRKAGIEEAILVQADADIQFAKRIRLRDLTRISFAGRGGTDFRPAFDYIQKRHRDTNLIIYFTDGVGYAPQKPPRNAKVIWCVVRTKHARRPATWGHVVVCDKNQQLGDPITS